MTLLPKKLSLSIKEIQMQQVTILINFGKSSKISSTFLFLFSAKMLVIRAGIHKMLVKIANRWTLIRLLLKKQSDLGLHCLPMPF